MRREPDPRLGALVSVSVHVLAGAALLSYEPARSALLAAAPLMVELIAPPAIVETPPAPKQRVQGVPRPLPRLPEHPPASAAPAEPSVPVMAVPPPPPAAPVASIALAVPPAPAVPAESEALPLTPPVFNAAYLNNPPPEYPPLSARLGEEGLVLLQVLVGIAGAPEGVQVLKSSGYTRLDQAACEAVRRWTFVPARRGAEKVAALAQVPIRFHQKD